MKTTNENLKTAFAGESQANQKYRAFAKKAEKDGFPIIAKLFKTTAEAERIHAEGHLKALEGVGSTLDNLLTAIAGETFEYEEMYPEMYEQAKEEKHKAKKMFKWAMETEKVHAELYKLALEAVKAGKDLEGVDFYLCPLCGHIEMGKPTERCPYCGVKPEDYVLV